MDQEEAERYKWERERQPLLGGSELSRSLNIKEGSSAPSGGDRQEMKKQQVDLEKDGREEGVPVL